MADGRTADATRKAQATVNTTKLYCPSFCVKCAEGGKTVFINRAKGAMKQVMDAAVIPASAVAPHDLDSLP